MLKISERKTRREEISVKSGSYRLRAINEIDFFTRSEQQRQGEREGGRRLKLDGDGKASRQMLNGACKYREPRHKGCAKAERGAEVEQAERRRREEREKEAMYAVGSSCAGPEG